MTPLPLNGEGVFHWLFMPVERVFWIFQDFC